MSMNHALPLTQELALANTRGGNSVVKHGAMIDRAPKEAMVSDYVQIYNVTSDRIPLTVTCSRSHSLTSP